MSWFYRNCIRPVLFTQDSEAIHERTLRALAWAGRNELAREFFASNFSAPPLPVEVFGLKFNNPVGLAAGMDKYAQALPIWPALGFGFSEIGGVTWHPQPGNDAPRMFRAVPDEALVNRMGFNNHGAECLAATLQNLKSSGRWPAHPVGINLGKSKSTPLDQAPLDYAKSFQALRGLADFFVVNVSSPNTPNLRQLQEKSALDNVLAAIMEQNPSRVPVLVKISPDLSLDTLDAVLEVALARRLSGIVATNTTVSRPQATNPAYQKIYDESGGLSGRPLRSLSTQIVRHIYQQTASRLPIIGVGGIFSAADAWEKITAGASLVEVYTGLVFEGPSLARSITTGLQNLLSASGLSSLSDAVGLDVAHSEK